MSYDDDNSDDSVSEPDDKQSGKRRDLVPASRGGALVPQAHGGALRPWTPGNGPGSGSAARRSSVRAIKAEALELLASGTVEASQRLLTLMTSRDERVACIASEQVLNRVLGKPGEHSQAQSEATGQLDLTRLSPEARREAFECLNRLKELTGLALTDGGAG